MRFSLSYREVEEILHERGIEICHETIRFWVERFGQKFDGEIRKRRRSGSKWRLHVDEVFVKINGELRYLWRAVDHEGEVLERFVTKRRNRRAALKFLKKAMKKHGNPDEIITDGCPSYEAALKEMNMKSKAENGALFEQLLRKLPSPLSAKRTGNAVI